jgi:hypothetical protein
MASRGALAARTATASGTIDQNMRRIAAKLKIEVPAAPVIPTRQPEVKAAVQMERLAGFLQAVADAVGAKPLEDAGPRGPADGGAVPPPAENEPPHTQTVTPLAAPQPAEPVAEGDDDHEEVEEVEEDDAETGQKRRVRRPRAKKK